MIYSDALAPLIAQIRQQAQELAQLGALVSAEKLLVAVANQIEACANEDAQELLAPKEAATESGYTSDQLRRKANAGQLTNYGTQTKALYRRSELPRRSRPGTPLLREKHGDCTVAPTRKQIARAVVNSQ